MAAKLWYIKERHNPQLHIYYVAMGQMFKTEAKRYEKTTYGYNYMIPFTTQKAYDDKIAELRSQGAIVQ